MPEDDEGLQPTGESAYETAMRYADIGMAVACIPVWYNDGYAVFTTGGIVNNLETLMPMVVPHPETDGYPREDSIMIAFAAINHARAEAEKMGAELLV